MQAHIFTEGSNTTADSTDQPVKGYYRGLFGTVTGFHEELWEFTDAHLHVLSAGYGVVRGERKVSTVSGAEQTPVGPDEMVERATRDVVREIWDDLVDAAKQESIRRLGAARRSLEGLDFEALKAKGGAVLTYQRVGVARIGAETREELLESVRQKSTR